MKVDRTKGEGITLEKLDIDIENLTPNVILSSPIFVFDQIFARNSNLLNVRTEETFQEMTFNDQLEEEIKGLAKKSDLKIKDLFLKK